MICHESVQKKSSPIYRNAHLFSQHWPGNETTIFFQNALVMNKKLLPRIYQHLNKCTQFVCNKNIHSNVKKWLNWNTHVQRFTFYNACIIQMMLTNALDTGEGNRDTYIYVASL